MPQPLTVATLVSYLPPAQWVDDADICSTMRPSVPFLIALDYGRPHEFVLTRRRDRQVALPGITAESAVVVEGEQVRLSPQRVGLPAFVVEWLRQVRASELLMIQAISKRSYDVAVQALVIHPNVASLRHAERLAEKYFRKVGDV